jgi:hypothetical protein
LFFLAKGVASVMVKEANFEKFETRAFDIMQFGFSKKEWVKAH